MKLSNPVSPVSAFTWLIAVLVMGCPGWFSVASAQEVPFTGVVNQNQTDVRAGAADSFYRVGELKKGRLVRVDEVIVGWYKIVPPEGVHSYISKAFVDAKGDGSVGVVNTDRSEAKAADLNGPAGSYRTQAILNEGDGVQIVGEEGSHYRIVAPPNAYVYLPPGTVRRALAMEIAAEEEPQEPVEPQPVEQPEVIEPKPDPVVPDPVKPDPVVQDPVVEPAQPVEPEPVVQAPVVEEAKPVKPAAVVVVEPEAADSSVEELKEMLNDPADEPVVAVEVYSLTELESQREAMLELPLEDRPIDEMIAKYEALRAAGGLSQADAYRVATRLGSLRHDREIAEGLIAIAAARDPESQAQTQPVEAVSYDAVGRLLASSVYDGKTLPRMYRLADPATGRAVAYIRPGGPVDTTGYLGRLVGVQGERAYDPALKLNVFTVKRIDGLQAAD